MFCVNAPPPRLLTFIFSLFHSPPLFSFNLSLPSAMQFTVNADLSRHNSRVRFQDNNQGSYTGFLSMPATRCRTLKLGLVVRDPDTLYYTVLLPNDNFTFIH